MRAIKNPALIIPKLVRLMELRENEGLRSLFRKYRDFTMIAEAPFIENLLLCREFAHVPGCVVECGVWRGGMIAAIAEVLGPDRRYYLLDSFEGLPRAEEIDGPSALAWQADKKDPSYYDNCRAEPRFAERAMTMSGAKHHTLVPGWFSETLPRLDLREEIAVLRLDGDWYESTMTCLTRLVPSVKRGGVVIIDDYYAWDGCAKAVHDYFSRNSLPARLQRTSRSGVCFFEKTW